MARRAIPFVAIVGWLAASATYAQTTSFTHQGRLNDGGSPANGLYDFQFTLWDALTGGGQQGSPNTVTATGVTVAGGVFTVQLDFGAAGFPGADRFLEMNVRPNGGGAYTLLTPRQKITSVPYAIRAGVVDFANVANKPTLVSAATGGGGVTGSISGSTLTLGSDTTIQRRTAGSPLSCSAGQYIQSVAQDGTPTCVTAASGGYVFMTGMINPANLTPYWTTLSGDSTTTTNSPEVGGAMPVACTFNQLQVTLNTSNGAGGSDTITVTLYKNRVATGLACSVVNSGTNGGMAFCTSSTAVPVVAGDTVSLGYAQTNNTPIIRIAVGTRCQ